MSTTDIVIIDLDEVMCDTNELLLPIFNHTFNQNFTAADWTNYDICSLYGITPEQYYELFDKFNLASNAPPCEGALEAIDMLLYNSILPVFVTARRPDVDLSPTLKWFARHRVDNLHLHVIGHQNKANYVNVKYVQSGHKLLGAYDDSNWNMFQFHEIFPSATLGLVDRPHNRCFNHDQYPNVRRTPTLLSGITDLLREQYDIRH